MTAVVFGALILSHLHERDGNSLMAWCWTGVAIVATAIHATMVVL